MAFFGQKREFQQEKWLFNFCDFPEITSDFNCSWETMDNGYFHDIRHAIHTSWPYKAELSSNFY